MQASKKTLEIDDIIVNLAFISTGIYKVGEASAKMLKGWFNISDPSWMK